MLIYTQDTYYKISWAIIHRCVTLLCHKCQKNQSFKEKSHIWKWLTQLYYILVKNRSKKKNLAETAVWSLKSFCSDFFYLKWFIVKNHISKIRNLKKFWFKIFSRLLRHLWLGFWLKTQMIPKDTRPVSSQVSKLFFQKL